MGKIVAKPGIERQEGYLYFVDKKGNVVRVRMKRPGKKASKKHEIVVVNGVKRKKGYLYYIDKKGNICEAKMRIGRRKKSKNR